jgi:hypothetical protein
MFDDNTPRENFRKNDWTKNSFKSLLSRHYFRTINISVVMGIWLLFLCEKLNLD